MKKIDLEYYDQHMKLRREYAKLRDDVNRQCRREQKAKLHRLMQNILFNERQDAKKLILK